MSKHSKHSASPALAYLRYTLREHDPASLESAVVRHLADCVQRFGEGGLGQAARTADAVTTAWSRFSQLVALNDRLRMTFSGGQVVLTSVIAELPPAEKAAVLRKVREFDDFHVGNDPWGEHDFGSFEHGGMKIYWKIDYYDPEIRYGSEDPCDPALTTRVLTVLLSTEY